MELVEDRVRITLEDIGEGWSGDYCPEDPDDDPLLRFTVEVLEDGEWREVDDASYCTAFPATATAEQQAAALRILMTELHDLALSGGIKKPAERMSWISLEWLEKGVPV